MPDLSEPWIFFARIALAGALGAIIGVERDLHGRPAGLRTNMLIAIGACLFGILSSEAYDDETGTQDPTRIASIVVQGIGFLGAGVVLKDENRIIGLTTAATIWLGAAIGLAVGAGMELLGTAVALLNIIAVVALRPVSGWLEDIGNRRMKMKGEKVVKEA